MAKLSGELPNLEAQLRLLQPSKMESFSTKVNSLDVSGTPRYISEIVSSILASVSKLTHV